MSTNTDSAVLPLRAGTWAVDHDHSSIGFAVRHLGVSKVRGRFRDFRADVVVGDRPSATSVRATVDLASIDTGNADRDAHVRAPDLLDVARRPTMTFRSTQLTGGDDEWQLHGDLTIGAVTRPLSLDVAFGGVETFVDGRAHAGFDATGQLRRSDFGLEFRLPPGIGSAVVGDAIRIEMDIQLVEPDA